MSWKVYIAPLTAEGVFADYIDVTFEVKSDSIGNVKIDTQKNEFDVGLPAVSNIDIVFQNSSGAFSDTGTTGSIFPFRRSGSKCKLAWHEIEPPILGMAIAGKAVLGSEIEVFEGFIADLDAEEEIKSVMIEFTILGKESIFESTETPFADLNIGDLMSDAIFTILNQTKITDVLTVDIGNFTLGRDQTLDTLDNFENSTVNEALEDLLGESNSILIIQDGVVYISDRSPSVDVEKIFYGQASDLGPEDIANLSDISNGQKKLWNLWTWKETSLSKRSSSSIDDFGLSKKEISFDQITDTTKRENILQDYLDSLGFRRKEMRLTTPVTRESLLLQLLSKIQIDYPTPVVPSEIGGTLPEYNFAQYNIDKYPTTLWNFRISLLESYKILAIDINPQENVIEFYVREI